MIVMYNYYKSKKFVDNDLQIEYCRNASEVDILRLIKDISLIQSGGVIGDYEAAATPHGAEGAVLSDTSLAL